MGMECEKILKRIQTILWKGVEESETSSKDCNIEKERNKENLQCGEL